MKLFIPVAAITLTIPLLTPLAAIATQATGRVSNGYYWLLTDAGQWQCRSINTGQIQRYKLCTDAGAVKPQRGQFLR